MQPVLNFSNFLITEAREKNSNAFDVAVLGGGLSGLVCARSLVSAGLKVVRYRCYKPGQESKFQGLESQPVGNFFFVGEHCSDKFGGFMNGAAESGLATAKKILSL